MRDHEIRQGQTDPLAKQPVQIDRMDQQACRETGRGILLSRARDLRRQAEKLERLANALPNEMHPDADEALWDLALRVGR